MNKKTSALKEFLIALGIFLIFILFSFLFFFYLIQKDVAKNTEHTIVNHVDRQSIHLEDAITLHFEYLDVIASYLAGDDNLLSDRNMQLLETCSEKSSLELLAIITPDGTSTYSNGMKKSVSDRAYFQEAIAGERALSDPVISKADGSSRIVLAVPLVRGDEIVGVLGGSCDVSSISHMLFQDVYDGAGSTVIVNSGGEIISWDGDAYGITVDDNFFDACASLSSDSSRSSEQLRKNFTNRQAGLLHLKQESVHHYMAYYPLSLSDWYLCYLVPEASAQESYHFISDYELRFFALLVVAALVLLFIIFRSNSQKQLELLVRSQTDGLSGLLNKTNTEEQVNEWLSGSECTDFQVFFMLDIDGFKNVNDTQGHIVGDKVVHELGVLLQREFRDYDIIGRIGGDEFCILVKNSPTEEFAAKRAKRLCRHIREHTFSEITSGHITVSVGVSIAPQHGRTYNELYAAADKALYETKENGKDGFTIYAE